jgi:hypothetical protein
MSLCSVTSPDEQLAHLDRLAPLLEKQHPEFVASYWDKRKITHFAASRSLSEQEKAVELAAILVKRDATLAKVRQLRASLAVSKAGEVSGSTNRNGTPIPAREDPGQLAVDAANGLVA